MHVKASRIGWSPARPFGDNLFKLRDSQRMFLLFDHLFGDQFLTRQRLGRQQ